jgi:large subunit ribosomal protein L5
MKSRLYYHYETIVKEELMLKFQYSNVHQIPKIKKVVVDTSMKSANFKLKLAPSLILALTIITGQKAAPTLAKKGNAKLGIRKGAVTGAKVTLRNEKMFQFIDFLITLVLPRVKNFEGIKSTSLNNQGNLTIQIKDPFTFPQLEAATHLFNNVGAINITFVTSTDNKDESACLLRGLTIPLK